MEQNEAYLFRGSLDIFCPAKITSRQKTEILFAGRFTYQKNPLYAVEVFAEYHKINCNSHFTMIGKGKLLPKIEERLISSGLSDYVTIIPETSKMEEYYRNADVFLLPSNYEGLGIVLIEAQACGTKCLTSNQVPATTDCGLIRYLPLNNNFRDWVLELERIKNDQSMSVNFETLELFSIQNTTKQIERLYESRSKTI